MAEKPINKLSASWMNMVAENVMDQVDRLIEHIVIDGLLVDGYLPFTQPPSKEVLQKMTSAQLQTMLDQPGITIQDQAIIVRMLESLPSTVVPEPTKLPSQ